MTDEKYKSKQSPEKTGSSGSRSEQGGDTAQLVDLLTKVLKSVHKQVEAEPKATLEGKAKQAVVEYKKISEALGVPTQLDPDIDPLKKWHLPPINPRANPSARAKEKE